MGFIKKKNVNGIITATLSSFNDVYHKRKSIHKHMP